MNTLDQIRNLLLDRDGSCRDVNFSNPTWDGVLAMVCGLADEFPVQHAGTGSDVPIPGCPDRLLQYRLTDGSKFISEIQVFIYREDGGAAFAELTFFPEDLQVSDDSAIRCLRFFDRIKQKLGADHCFIRYENASWEFGDCGDGSGMIAHWSVLGELEL